MKKQAGVGEEDTTQPITEISDLCEDYLGFSQDTICTLILDIWSKNFPRFVEDHGPRVVSIGWLDPSKETVNFLYACRKRGVDGKKISKEDIPGIRLMLEKVSEEVTDTLKKQGLTRNWALSLSFD